MLNELLAVERGLREAGMVLSQRHPSIKEARQVSTLVVHLGEDGAVVSIRPLPPEIRAWTLRDGQHNSFPFVQPKNALLAPNTDDRAAVVGDRKRSASERRSALLELVKVAGINPGAVAEWFGRNLVRRLRERIAQAPPLPPEHEGRVLWATIERFLKASDPEAGGDARRLVAGILEQLLASLQLTGEDDWIHSAAGMLVGKRVDDQWLCDSALLFDAAGFPLPIYHPRVVEAVSLAMSTESCNETHVRCALTGILAEPLQGEFPQPRLPEIGQTYLFAKNRDIPANERYGRAGTDAMVVGQGTVVRLRGAIEALTDSSLKNITWRPVPSERAGQRDLLVAFVEGALKAPITELLVEEDFSMEETADEQAQSIGMFRELARRLIDTLQAKVSSALNTQVQLLVLRRVDPANRKVIHSGALRVKDLYDAALTWADGEANVPDWVTIPIVRKGRIPKYARPPHVSPLGLVSFSKLLYTHAGAQQQEVTGLPAAEALGLFLSRRGPGGVASRWAKRWLLLVLTRRLSLVVAIAEALRRPDGLASRYDLTEALRTISVLGILLHKLERDRRMYMNGAAFKLGQLLAAADAVHAGYCADVRNGEVPPALLGNQVFGMAQSAPATALATLCRRWKPYDGWVKKVTRQMDRIDQLIASNNKTIRRRGWDIKVAIRSAREAAHLATVLAPILRECRTDDVFRAELLLGYVAGLPPTSKDELSGSKHESDEQEG